MTTIQKLEEKKRQIHLKDFQTRYPNGCYSLQIQYGQYGSSGKNDPIRRVELRWGIKTTSTQYWSKSFRVEENGKISNINHSFGYVYNFDSLKKLLLKCKKENIPDDLIKIFIQECMERKIAI